MTRPLFDPFDSYAHNDRYLETAKTILESEDQSEEAFLGAQLILILNNGL
jgi:hypothetical protein